MSPKCFKNNGFRGTDRRCRTMSKIVPSPSSCQWKCSARFQKLLQKIYYSLSVYLPVCLSGCFLICLPCQFLFCLPVSLLVRLLVPIRKVSQSLRKVSQRGCLDWVGSASRDVMISKEKTEVGSMFEPLAGKWEACASQTFQKQWFQRDHRCRIMS